MEKNKNPGKAHQDHSPQHSPEHAHVRQAQEREHHDREQLGQEKHQVGQISPAEQHTSPHNAEGIPEKGGITVYIDNKPHHVASAQFTGAELRKLTSPPIGPDKNIFRVVSGIGDDIKLGDADVIKVDMRAAHQGRHFFTDTLVPSKDAVARRAYYIYLEHGSQPGHDAENWAKAETQLSKHSKK